MRAAPGPRLAALAAASAVAAGCSFSAPAAGGDDPGGVDGAIDAARPDAGIDAAPPACPAAYQTITGLTSRYRQTAPGSYRAVHADCKDDLLGRTHLVVFDDAAESDLVRAAYNVGAWWIGAVQRPDRDEPGEGWRNITGGALAGGLWARQQPNDGGASGAGSEEEDRQNVAGRTLGGVEDFAARPIPLTGVCECDGRPVDTYVEADIPP